MPLARLKQKTLREGCASRIAIEPRNRMVRRDQVHERRLAKRELRELVDREAWQPSTTE